MRGTWKRLRPWLSLALVTGLCLLGLLVVVIATAGISPGPTPTIAP